MTLVTGKRSTSRKKAKSAKGKPSSVRHNSHGVLSGLGSDQEPLATFKNAAGLILAVTENRNWIEVFFEGDTMHTKTVELPWGRLLDIYVEEIPHKTTVYEHPRTMILFNGPCDLQVTRDGDRVVISGQCP